MRYALPNGLELVSISQTNDIQALYSQIVHLCRSPTLMLRQ